MSTKLPSAFLRSLIENHRFEEEAFIKSHEDPEQITSIRLNPFKPIDPVLSDELVPWCSKGRYLSERPVFTADPLFHAGCYYVQEASSMFLEQVIKHSCDLSRDLKVVDLCAAPGGKSTHIASLINEDSFLLSNEIIKTRVPVLSDNLTKWGTLNTFVSNNDPRDFKRLGAYFDLAVVDAPCSGSGMFRKDPAAISEWSENAVALCSQRQQRILADIYPALKEDGVLIYSTCSYSKTENEDIADWLCDTFGLSSIQIPVEPHWGIEETRSDKHQCWSYRFYPHKVKSEGFFISCFRKNEPTDSVELRQAKDTALTKTSQLVKGWIADDHNARIITLQDELLAIHRNHAADLQHLQRNLYLKKSGIRIGKPVGKYLVPNHELALSRIASTSIPRIDLDRDMAIAYLKRDEVKPATDYKGWALICYQNHPLGWAKLLGNRLNNYYPKEWRIVNAGIGR